MQHPAVLLLSWESKWQEMVERWLVKVRSGVRVQECTAHCTWTLSCSAVGTPSTLPTLNPTNTRLVACMLSIYSFIYMFVKS